MNSVTLRAPAKVNLGLAVGPRRPDGFHDLVTVMVPLELHDNLRVSLASDGIDVTCNHPAVPAGPANITHRAAAAFFAAARIGTGCRIRIEKRIPIGGGLGGGSSNAATVLAALNRLHGRPLSARRLRRVAAELGSDVPFFLGQGAQAARGRGERLRPIRLPRLDLVLCIPGHGVPTAWAYAALDRQRARRPALTSFRLSPKMLGAALRRAELDKVAVLVRNDFEPVIFRKYPALARARELLLRHGAYAAALSGSGSTVYGLVRTHGWKDPMAALGRHGFRSLHTRTT